VKGEDELTTRADFTPDEWSRLVQLPRWVVAAASASQRDTPHRTNVEIEAGLLASAHGRDTGNTFVAEVGEELMQVFDNRSTVNAIEFTDVEAGIGAVLDQSSAAMRLIGAKGAAVDAAAYRGWLLGITDVVIKAARTGDFMGFGGVLVTESEHRFRDRLAEALQTA
jgi:hypothetical protein